MRVDYNIRVFGLSMNRLKIYSVLLLSVTVFACTFAPPKKQSLPKPAHPAPQKQADEFPQQVFNYRLLRKKIYPRKELGVSVRYLETSSRKAYFDFYVYPVLGNALKDGYEQTKAGIFNAMKQGAYQQVEILSEDTVALAKGGKDKSARRGLFKIKKDDVPYYSVLYLAIKDGMFFKIRATYPYNEQFADSDHLQAVFEQLYRQVDVERLQMGSGVA